MDDWVWAADLLSRKQPVFQLSPLPKIVILKLVQFNYLDIGERAASTEGSRVKCVFGV